MKRFTNTSKKLSIIFVAAALAYILLVSPWPGNLRGPGGLESQAQTNNLNITHVVMQYVKRYYVNQGNIDPKAMLIEGLGTLERIHDQILVSFPNGEESTSFEVQAVDEKASFDMRQVNDLDSVTKTLEEVFGFITPRISDQEPKLQDMEYAVLDQMLKSLDQHSGIITPDVYKEFMIETEGSFGGLGIVIGIRDGELTVISPIEGTPAYRMGIKPNDKIVQIGHESTVNMSLIEAVSKLRGRRGTEVTIFIDRETFPKPKEFKITRDTIKIESVETFELDDGIRYVRIRDFQKNTLDSIIENLNNSPNNPSGMIVDLRGNPGGLLDQAERISDLFLTSGVIVTTKVGNSAKRYHANDKDRQYKGKVVVLVDSGSASASEILAGALKNNERAVVIGERTFGKGSVQQIFDMTDGSALKLTIAQYLTPGDISIQDVGVTPDIVLHPAIITEDTVVFDTTLPKLRRDGQEKKNEQELEKPIYSIQYLENNVAQSEDKEPIPEEALSREEKLEKLENDFYISLAKDILLSSTSPTRKDSLGKIKNNIGKITKEQEDKIVDKWRVMGIDWSTSDTSTQGSSVSVNVVPPLPTGNAGEELEITVEVENTGPEPLYRLHASTSSENAIFAGKEFIFGKLAPGEKKSWTTTVELPKWSLTRQDEITLKFIDANNSKIGDFTFNAGIEALPRPLYAFNYEIVDDGRLNSSGNANGVAETGEMVTLLLRVKNIGTGASEKTILTLKNESGESVFLDKGRVELEMLEPGETQEAVFSFHLLKPSNLAEMELQIVDEIFREGITSNVWIPGKIKDREFTLEEYLVTVPQANTPIRGGSYQQAPIIAISEKDAVFKTIGTNSNWIKIALDEKLSGWIDKDKTQLAVNSNGNSNNGTKPSYIETFETPPIISISDLPLFTSTGTVTLSGDVNDNDGIELISVFVGDDKVALLPSSQTKVPVSLDLKLDEEVNLITIIAKDSKGLLSKQSFVVRKEG